MPLVGTVRRTYDDDFWVATEEVNISNLVSFAYGADGLLTAAGTFILTLDPQNGLRGYEHWVKMDLVSIGVQTVTTPGGIPSQSHRPPLAPDSDRHGERERPHVHEHLRRDGAHDDPPHTGRSANHQRRR